jgi:hypothetical protein
MRCVWQFCHSFKNNNSCKKLGQARYFTLLTRFFKARSKYRFFLILRFNEALPNVRNFRIIFTFETEDLEIGSVALFPILILAMCLIQKFYWPLSATGVINHMQSCDAFLDTRVLFKLLWLWEQMTLLVGGIIYNCVKSEK